METFEITENHLKLAKQLYWEWESDAYSGYPAVNCKRPYGNSDVYDDVAEIIGLEKVEGDEGEMHWPKGTRIICKRFHEEMATAMQIFTCTLSFESGIYIKKDAYCARSWIKQ